MQCLPRKSQKPRLTSHHLAHAGYLHHSHSELPMRSAVDTAICTKRSNPPIRRRRDALLPLQFQPSFVEHFNPIERAR
jgi:hypothetical protein